MGNNGFVCSIFAAGMMILSCAGTAVAVSGQNGADAEKRAYALQYLQATHATGKWDEAAKQIIPNVVNSIKQTHPGLSNSTVERFRRSFTARMAQNAGKLREIQVQALTTTFSARELKEASAYYASPTGQHFQAVSMQLMGEIMGQRQEMFNDAIRAAMKDANIPLPKVPPPGNSPPAAPRPH